MMTMLPSRSRRRAAGVSRGSFPFSRTSGAGFSPDPTSRETCGRACTWPKVRALLHAQRGEKQIPKRSTSASGGVASSLCSGSGLLDHGPRSACSRVWRSQVSYCSRVQPQTSSSMWCTSGLVSVRSRSAARVASKPSAAARGRRSTPRRDHGNVPLHVVLQAPGLSDLRIGCRGAAQHVVSQRAAETRAAPALTCGMSGRLTGPCGPEPHDSCLCRSWPPLPCRDGTPVGP